MNIKGKIYPVVKVSRQRIPKFDHEVRVEDSNVSVITVDEDGDKFWTPLSWLKSEYESDQEILEYLLYQLKAVRSKLDMSKAALKRELINYGLISK